MGFLLERSQTPEPIPHMTDSSSLMPAFMVSAPGKVIVYGEHAVVYGKAAIAAAISLRSYLLVTLLPESNRTVCLRSPDIDLNQTWNIDDLPWNALCIRDQKKNDCRSITTLDQELVEALQPHIKMVSSDRPQHIRKIHQASAFAFLYLFISLGSQHSDSVPCAYSIRSTIPVGAGLGSSASLSVCLATALLLQTKALNRPHLQASRESEVQIDQINRWAFVAEMCIHGNPSGVDNTVSSGGKAVMFQRKDPLKPPVVTPLCCFPELPLLLVNTKEPRNATDEITKVKVLRNRYPLIVNGILSAIDAATNSAYKLISAQGFDPKLASTQQHLGDLITINHGLLVSLGVSHPKLERICTLVDRLDIGWTKLTGAGGGGCAIVMPKPGVEVHPKKQCISATAAHELETSETISPVPNLADLDRMLADEGMEMFTTTLAGDGVGVLWPAVLQDVLGEDGIMETDQEKFLRAEGKESIEKLVGMSVAPNGEAMVGCRDGWRFWRR